MELRPESGRAVSGNFGQKLGAASGSELGCQHGGGAIVQSLKAENVPVEILRKQRAEKEPVAPESLDGRLNRRIIEAEVDVLQV